MSLRIIMFSDKVKKLATETLEACRNKGLQVSTAESCTGGLIIGALTEIAGSSDVVDRGFITYTNQAKMEMLDVSEEVLRRDGAVSPDTAMAMARGAIKNSDADIAVSVTGIAGPGGGTDRKPVGLVQMAGLKRGGQVVHQQHNFGDIGRDGVREATVIATLNLIKSLA